MILRTSKLRKRDEVALGPKYSGSHISRDTLLQDDESDDDPFGSPAGQENEVGGSDESDIVDPEDVERNGQEIDVDEDIDSGEAFEHGDEDRFKSFKFRGSSASNGVQQGRALPRTAVGGIISPEDEELGSDADEAGDVDEMSLDTDSNASDDISQEDDEENQGSEASESDSEDEEDSSEPGSPRADDRAELRKLMAEEQKSVVATISQAAKSDAAKGNAVKQQRSTFDALLNTRIRLQKALIATNSLSATPNPEHIDADSEAGAEAIKSAEKAAFNLWNKLNTLRTSIQLPPSANPKKRPFSATSSTPTSTLWTQMQSQESTSFPTRRTTLMKWSQRVHLASSLPTHNKLTNTSTHQPLTSILDTQLSSPNAERLIKRTQIPRSCAPLQQQQQQQQTQTHSKNNNHNNNKQHIPAADSDPQQEDPSIYDDSDLYTLLLRDLLDQRMATSSSSSTAANPLTSPLPIPTTITTATARLLARSTRPRVDTKASKGRKLRYTVHEKLQNFMAPEDRGTWGQRQADELFAGLLGRRGVLLGEGEGEGGEEGDRDREEEGLRLFRGEGGGG